MSIRDDRTVWAPPSVLRTYEKGKKEKSITFLRARERSLVKYGYDFSELLTKWSNTCHPTDPKQQCLHNRMLTLVVIRNRSKISSLEQFSSNSCCTSKHLLYSMCFKYKPNESPRYSPISSLVTQRKSATSLSLKAALPLISCARFMKTCNVTCGSGGVNEG